MTSNEQKKIWNNEKEQQLRDKENQPKKVERTKVNLSFGGKKKQKNSAPNKPSSDPIADDYLRKQLGL